MSNCTGCANASGDNPNPHAKECEVCIRNPKYPSRKMPEKAILEGIEIEIPQDMYIARDRKNFEEKRMMKKLSEMISSILSREKKKKNTPRPNRPWTPKPDYKPRKWYWEYAHQTTAKE